MANVARNQMTPTNAMIEAAAKASWKWFQSHAARVGDYRPQWHLLPECEKSNVREHVTTTLSAALAAMWEPIDEACANSNEDGTYGWLTYVGGSEPVDGHVYRTRDGLVGASSSRARGVTFTHFMPYSAIPHPQEAE